MKSDILKPTTKILRKDMVKTSTLFTIISLTTISCAPPVIHTTVLMPADFPEASKLKAVAVLPFGGSYGEAFAAELEAALFNIKIDDQPYFSVVDRTHLDRVMREMRLAQRGVVDPDTAVKIGKVVGVQGIYTGVVAEPQSDDSHYQEERRRCVHSTPKGVCDEWEKYPVLCTKRTATFSFTLKLIAVETGRVVYANSITRNVSDRACLDSPRPITSSLELIQQAKQAGLSAVIQDIAPHYVPLTIPLMDSTQGIPSEEAKKKFQDALHFAKNHRLDRACELWEEARTISPDAPSILYDLGVCAEVTGELDQALDLYKKADQLLGKPDKKVSAAISRVSELIQKQKKLKE